MTSLFYYDAGIGYLADAIYDEKGDFDYYDLPDDNETDGFETELGEDMPAEQLTLLLKESEIEGFEDQDVFRRSDEIEEMAERDDDSFAVLPSHCSLNRTVSWFNAKDCAILTAWRNGKARKTNGWIGTTKCSLIALQRKSLTCKWHSTTRLFLI